MRHLRLGVFALAALVLVLAGGAAYAATPKQAVFRVTLSATLTKDWTFTRVEDELDCTRTTNGVGKWQVKLGTRGGSRIRIFAGSRGRLRFSGTTLRAIAGAASQTGTMTVTTRGQAPCDRMSRAVRCARQQRSFRGAATSLATPRKGVLRVGRLRGADAIRSFGSQCPEEPGDIRAIRTDLPLATGPLSAADVFDRTVARFFVSGESEQVTTIEGDTDGHVTERVHWTVTFTRLKR